METVGVEVDEETEEVQEVNEVEDEEEEKGRGRGVRDRHRGGGDHRSSRKDIKEVDEVAAETEPCIVAADMDARAAADAT